MVRSIISRRLMALLSALLLTLSLAGTALAAPLANPEFGSTPTCNTGGWLSVITGTAGTGADTENAYAIGASSNCVGRNHAHSTGPLARAELNQRFDVPVVSGPIWLNLEYWLRTAGGPPNAAGQFIGVFDWTTGSPVQICGNRFNTTSGRMAGYSCEVTGATQIELRTSAQANAGLGYPETWLHFDHVRFNPGPVCPLAPAFPGSAQICP